ncbi:MAG: lytic murein transglycosylase [Desulfobacterota bacterium]|nr:lytic murein transglycosylase [Thermodesulfobacteriota bacterium]
MRLLCFILVLLLAGGGAMPSGHAEGLPSLPLHYRGLVERLIQDGLEKEFLIPLFLDPRAEPIPNRLTISLMTREVPELYSKFLSFESILLAKNFLRENRRVLLEMERTFDVEKEIAVAILLVESRFGENIGRHRVIPTLASLAILNSEENLLRNFSILWPENPEVPFSWIEHLASRRANWAYKELKHFLQIVRSEELDPLEVYGSIAGALGLPQFIPSSYLAYAVKRKGFKEWLYDVELAIFSIGNFLKSHGWRRGLSEAQQRKLLWHYNRSEPYGETIVEIARRLKKGPD